MCNKAVRFTSSRKLSIEKQTAKNKQLTPVVLIRLKPITSPARTAKKISSIILSSTRLAPAVTHSLPTLKKPPAHANALMVAHTPA